jgi:hypothetical protein
MATMLRYRAISSWLENFAMAPLVGGAELTRRIGAPKPMKRHMLDSAKCDAAITLKN